MAPEWRVVNSDMQKTLRRSSLQLDFFQCSESSIAENGLDGLEAYMASGIALQSGPLPPYRSSLMSLTPIQESELYQLALRLRRLKRCHAGNGPLPCR